MAGYWPCSFIAILLTATSSWYIKMQKELGQYPAMLTSHLIKNTYVSWYYWKGIMCWFFYLPEKACETSITYITPLLLVLGQCNDILGHHLSKDRVS